MKPDFLITPYEVKIHPDLRPSDGDVYAVVYWFERLKDGKCTASNETIGDVARIEPRSVRASLDRLEKAGFIERIFIDKRRKFRAEIKTLVYYTKKEKTDSVVFKMKENYSAKEMGLEVTLETPGEFTKRFFGQNGEARTIVTNELLLKFPITVPARFVTEEISKFIIYWTEPTKSGKKQRWELQPTFDVRRRLATWFSNIKDRARARSGAGATV